MAEHRKCKATMRVWNKEARKYDVTELEGLFHRWGSVTTEDDNDHVGTDTMAIIEAADGKIFTAWPNDVIFLDK